MKEGPKKRSSQDNVNEKPSENRRNPIRNVTPNTHIQQQTSSTATHTTATIQNHPNQTTQIKHLESQQAQHSNQTPTLNHVTQNPTMNHPNQNPTMNPVMVRNTAQTHTKSRLTLSSINQMVYENSDMISNKLRDDSIRVVENNLNSDIDEGEEKFDLTIRSLRKASKDRSIQRDEALGATYYVYVIGFHSSKKKPVSFYKHLEPKLYFSEVDEEVPNGFGVESTTHHENGRLCSFNIRFKTLSSKQNWNRKYFVIKIVNPSNHIVYYTSERFSLVSKSRKQND